ncbi:MAG: cyclic lactone autoinducer peptide [Thermoanaerobacteraceae bacterium]
MNTKKVSFTSIVASLLAFVGTLGLASTTCIGWFYKPQVPDILTKKQ